jgi:hypothetical protein
VSIPLSVPARTQECCGYAAANAYGKRLITMSASRRRDGNRPSAFQFMDYCITSIEKKWSVCRLDDGRKAMDSKAMT